MYEAVFDKYIEILSSYRELIAPCFEYPTVSNLDSILLDLKSKQLVEGNLSLFSLYHRIFSSNVFFNRVASVSKRSVQNHEREQGYF